MNEFMTTEELAKKCVCSAKEIIKNYNENKARFVIGKHYIQPEGEMLWTVRGAAYHCKMLETEQAWEFFDALEDYYFQSPEERILQYAQYCVSRMRW